MASTVNSKHSAAAPPVAGAYPIGADTRTAVWDAHAWTGKWDADTAIEPLPPWHHRFLAFLHHAWFWYLVAGSVLTVISGVVTATTGQKYFAFTSLVGLAVFMVGLPRRHRQRGTDWHARHGTDDRHNCRRSRRRVAVHLRLLATDHHLAVPAPAPQRARARAARRDRTQPPALASADQAVGPTEGGTTQGHQDCQAPGRVAGWVPSTGLILKALRSVGRPQEIGTHREAGVHLAPCPTHPEPAPWNNCGVGKGPVRSGVSWHDPSALPTWL